MKTFFFYSVFFSILMLFFSCKKGDKGFVVDIDGNKYAIVQIGTQEWMAENLKTSRYNDGTPIPNVTDNADWEALSSGAFSYYDNDISNNNSHGKLYNWYAVGTGILCPRGWRIPNNSDWGELYDFLEGTAVGGKMKSTTGWDAPNIGATNESGFSAIGSGARNQFGSFNDLNLYSAWWAADSYEDNNALAWFRGIVHTEDGLEDGTTIKKRGFSCRCIKN